MAAPRALPAGFGELEVLAVGTVLLMEGEPSKTLGGARAQWFPEPRPQLWSGHIILAASPLCLDPGLILFTAPSGCSMLHRSQGKKPGRVKERDTWQKIPAQEVTGTGLDFSYPPSQEKI